MIRLVILDFDGTLADTRPLIVHTMQRTLEAMHLPPKSEEECATVIGLPLRECFTRLMSVGDEVGEQCAELYRRFFDEDNHPGAVVLFPHVLDTLHTLHGKGYRMAICSSRGRPTLEGFVQAFGLERYVEAIVSANDVQHAKPHPEPVLQILQATGVPAAEALVVGDASFDILMGRAAGCRTCGVTYGNQSAADLGAAGADMLIDDFAQLVSVVAA